MPLLPAETALYPEDLLQSPVNSVKDARWWVFHTRPRAEKSLARHLLRREIGFYLPLYERQWRTGGRLRTSHLPLFPGYLFARGDSQERLQALETNLVVQTLCVGDEARLVQDLQHVQRMIQSGLPLLPEERLEPGQPVEIISGPLQGLHGKVLRRGKQCTFVVEVDFLQRGASVEIDMAVCRPVEDTQERQVRADH
jgi:transcriptional antiterminator RfaH